MPEHFSIQTFILEMLLYVYVIYTSFEYMVFEENYARFTLVIIDIEPFI